MRWIKCAKTLSLKQNDLNFLEQHRAVFDELLRTENANPNIPPLWSVLSYTMLRCSCRPEGVWINYRYLKQLAQSASHYYLRYQIPKANGGYREIYAPRYILKAEQQFILNTILDGLPVDEHAFAYRKGISIPDCARPHVGQALLIHLDLKNFFGSINENMVYETLLAETGYSKSLCRFLAKLCCLHGSLPQGTVTSPALSNIVFRRCDQALAKLADKYAMQYTRYSDDLFFSGDPEDVTVLLQEISTLLGEYGFRLNPEKTQIRRRQHRQTVLGLTVNDGVQVTRAYRRKLRQELYQLEQFGEECEGAVVLGDYLLYMQKLQGKLAYIRHVGPDTPQLQQAHARLLRQIARHTAFPFPYN